MCGFEVWHSSRVQAGDVNYEALEWEVLSMLRQLLFVSAIGLPLYGAAAARSFAADAQCFADWGKAADVVRQQGLLTVEELAKTFANDIPGQIVRATLCQDGDDYIYKLAVRDKQGQLKNVVVDALNHAKAVNSR